MQAAAATMLKIIGRESVEGGRISVNQSQVKARSAPPVRFGRCFETRN